MSGRRRTDADVHGLLNICKSGGYTSHDVVAIVRRTLGTRRVGHAGTLDPAAQGVLPVCVGRTTRLVDALASASKGYYGEIVLGIRTSTDDAEGEVLETRPVPPLLPDDLERILQTFRGTIVQVPPAYSALKIAGRRAYDLARRGDDVRLQPREVTIHTLTVRNWSTPRLSVVVACSKGTYIRALARDIGVALGCGAHLATLVRLWVGGFRLADAISLEELQTAVDEGTLDRVLLPADAALVSVPVAVVDPDRARDFTHGRPWRAHRRSEPTVAARVYDTDGRLLGLATANRERGLWQPTLALVRTDG
ncbi:MAG: tRNA pseudouridine(55) synthase TruB [Chloroflexi bacterium]|nr:tRNA pseudouridine(55) synthase TruB [Chloroflexota bacterium]